MAKILIVDDDGALLMTIRAALMTKGHTVKQAQSGMDGVDLASKESFDLIITDANMPGGVSGFQLVENLRVSESHKETPVIFLTGRREKRDVIRALESGADAYIVKPIDYDALLAKVEHLLTAKKRAPIQGSQAASGTSFVSESASGSAPVQFAAAWHMKIQIETLTESGLFLSSGFKVPIQFEIELESSLFKEVGIKPPRLMVVACHENPGFGSGFTIETKFHGMSAGDTRKVADWIRAAGKK